MKSYIADDIMQEYNRKKQYEENKRWSELQKFIKETCKDCKNKKTDLCHVVRNSSGNLSCVFKE